jgi:hypothetical protein
MTAHGKKQKAAGMKARDAYLSLSLQRIPSPVPILSLGSVVPETHAS